LIKFSQFKAGGLEKIFAFFSNFSAYFGSLLVPIYVPIFEFIVTKNPGSSYHIFKTFLCPLNVLSFPCAEHLAHVGLRNLDPEGFLINLNFPFPCRREFKALFKRRRFITI